MRDTAFFLLFVAAMPFVFLMPHLGVLVWTWFSVANLHRELWGFATLIQFNSIIAAITLLAYIVSPERKIIPMTMHTALLALLGIWMVLSTAFAITPDYSQELLSRNIKTLILLVFAMLLINSRTRIHALVAVLCVALGYWGTKGGLFAVGSAGQYRIYGPDHSPIYDNNHLALALVMVIPLFFYLRMHTENIWVRRAILLVTFLSFAAVIASYSRGAYLALGALLFALWWRSPRKILPTALAGILAVASVFVIPQTVWERFNTVSSVDRALEDASFQERLEVWAASIAIARDRPLFGAGFSATEVPSVYIQYSPGTTEDKGRAVHSIYFQVLADLGFAGFIIYFLLILYGFIYTFGIINQTRDRPEDRWAYDLARMLQISMFVFLVGGAGLSMGLQVVTPAPITSQL
ncbi:MAG: putative O-glycosylation ligase, exosortase A system-associated [Pseudomonadota bacterium]